MSDWQTLRDRLGLTYKPIEEWPGKPRYDRERGPFSAPLKDTMQTLERELRMLSARSIVLQIAIRERDLRLDGLPRADARAEHPGVILTFDSKHGPLRIWFDRFTNWQHNLRAIAMHLEHLRLAGLYGVGKDGQQYAGWKALPAGSSSQAEFDTAEEAARFIARHSESSMANVEACAQRILVDEPTRQACYRRAAARLHPDAGGDHEQFVRLRRAMELLAGRG